MAKYPTGPLKPHEIESFLYLSARWRSVGNPGGASHKLNFMNQRIHQHPFSYFRLSKSEARALHNLESLIAIRLKTEQVCLSPVHKFYRVTVNFC